MQVNDAHAQRAAAEEALSTAQSSFHSEAAAKANMQKEGLSTEVSALRETLMQVSARAAQTEDELQSALSRLSLQVWPCRLRCCISCCTAARFVRSPLRSSLVCQYCCIGTSQVIADCRPEICSPFLRCPPCLRLLVRDTCVRAVLNLKIGRSLSGEVSGVRVCVATGDIGEHCDREC
jgi:hypothetical protein